MTLIQNQVWTADPGSIWTPKNSFMYTDPFAIVMGVQVDESVVTQGLLYDMVWQLVNPRQDPYNYAWYTLLDSNVVAMPTVDNGWMGVPFQWTNFASWLSWGQYVSAVSQVYGPDQISGVFYAQGTINVEGSDLFAAASPFWYQVRAE
jgi:hypothetical protein